MEDGIPQNVPVPGHSPVYETRTESCAVCQNPVEVLDGRYSTRYYCRTHDESDLEAMLSDVVEDDPLIDRYRLL